MHGADWSVQVADGKIDDFSARSHGTVSLKQNVVVNDC